MGSSGIKWLRLIFSLFVDTNWQKCSDIHKSIFPLTMSFLNVLVHILWMTVVENSLTLVGWIIYGRKALLVIEL